jgi:hypothetical protein
MSTDSDTTTSMSVTDRAKSYISGVGSTIRRHPIRSAAIGGSVVGAFFLIRALRSSSSHSTGLLTNTTSTEMRPPLIITVTEKTRGIAGSRQGHNDNVNNNGNKRRGILKKHNIIDPTTKQHQQRQQQQQQPRLTVAASAKQRGLATSRLRGEYRIPRRDPREVKLRSSEGYKMLKSLPFPVKRRGVDDVVAQPPGPTPAEIMEDLSMPGENGGGILTDIGNVFGLNGLPELPSLSSMISGGELQESPDDNNLVIIDQVIGKDDGAPGGPGLVVSMNGDPIRRIICPVPMWKPAVADNSYLRKLPFAEGRQYVDGWQPAGMVLFEGESILSPNGEYGVVLSALNGSHNVWYIGDGDDCRLVSSTSPYGESEVAKEKAIWDANGDGKIDSSDSILLGQTRKPGYFSVVTRDGFIQTFYGTMNEGKVVSDKLVWISPNVNKIAPEFVDTTYCGMRLTNDGALNAVALNQETGEPISNGILYTSVSDRSYFE